MKKFLKDCLKEKQPIPEEALLEVFKAPKEFAANIKEELVVVYYASNQQFSVQVAYNTSKYESNNGYLVFVFNKVDELIFRVGVTSFFPHVWQRDFLPYKDLVNIQTKINQILKDNKLPEINFDFV